MDNEYMKNRKERGPNISQNAEKVAIRVPNLIHSRNVVPSTHRSILPSLADLITIMDPRSMLLSSVLFANPRSRRAWTVGESAMTASWNVSSVPLHLDSTSCLPALPSTPNAQRCYLSHSSRSS